MADTGEHRPSTLDLAVDPFPARDIVDTKAKHLQPRPALLEQMLRRVNHGYGYWRPIFQEARNDVEFAYGDQWPEDAKTARADRPMLQINHIAQFIHNALGNLKQSKFNVHVMQASGPNDAVPAWVGDTEYPTAEVMEGMIRDVERRSDAGHAYVRAVQHALEGGFGWLWVRTDQPDDNPFELELRIEHIVDRYSVLLDPFSDRDDFSDAEWGIVSQKLPMGEFRARYPQVPQTSCSIGDGFDTHYRDWWGGETHARISHYFYKEAMKRTAFRLRGRDGSEIVAFKDKLEDILDELAEGGYQKVDEKEINSFQVKHVLCTSNHILEGPSDWPGMRIPIVPVLGRQIDYDDRSGYAGLLRWTYDSQRMINYLVSSFIERIALSPKAPWLATADQIKNYQSIWDNQHLNNVNVLPYDHDETAENPAPPPKRQDPATFAAAEMQGILGFRSWMQDSIGMHEANLGKKSNETSGVAIQQRQNTGNMAMFDFVDNLAFSIASIGNLLCDLIPKVYSGDSIRRIILPDETQGLVRLNYTVEDEETGNLVRIANLELCRYTCAVRPGPAFQTLREQFVKMFMEIGRSNPQFAQGMFDLFVASLDMPFGREMTRRAKMMMPPHLLREEDRRNLPEPPQPEPTPEQQAEMAKAQAAISEAESKATLAQLDLDMKRDEQQHQQAMEQLKTQQQQEQTEQARLRTEQAGANLEATVEKGAGQLARQDREQSDQSNDAELEAKLRRIVARVRAEDM